MPARPVGVTDVATDVAVAEIDVIERASPEIVTTIVTTAQTNVATTLQVTDRSRFPQSGSFKVRVEGEVQLVTGGQGAGTGTFTVTRAQDGTTAVAHSIGVQVAQVVGVQRVEPIDASRQVTYKGRVTTFRTPGRAGTTGQKIFALHNATASPIIVDVEKIVIDVIAAAAAGVAPTVIPPVIKAVRFTAVPTNGTGLAKVPEDSALASNSAVTVWGDASADGTSSASALTVTGVANGAAALTQEFAPRILVIGTSASSFYEMFDKTTFFEDESVAITLRPLEGVCIFLDYTAAAANPTTSHYVVGCRWTEYTFA